jgi:hypothetical protein
MNTIRIAVLCLSLFFFCLFVSSPKAFGAQNPVAAPAAQDQPQTASQAVGTPFQPLGDYVPCLFTSEEVTGMRDVIPLPTAPREQLAIGANAALKVMDTMNSAIFKVIESYPPLPAQDEKKTPPSEEQTKSGDSRLFVQDFALRFFNNVDPVAIQSMKPIDAYAYLSKNARAVADAMNQEIQKKQSYNYFGYQQKMLASNRLSPDVETALSQVQNAISTAVRGALVLALEPKAQQLYAPPTDISCSVAVMGWREASDTFGRRVANQFLAIQVTVRNLNTRNEFLMHDIQVAVDTGLSTDSYFWTQYAGRFQAGRDKLLVRAVAQRGQSEDRRNLVLNSLMVIGAIAGSSAIVGPTDFKTAVAVFQGAFIPGFSTVFPDHTVEQLNHINDLVFSASNTSKVVVPIQGSVPLVTFISAKPIEQLPFAWCGYDVKYSQAPSPASTPSRHPCVYDPYTWRDASYPHRSFYADDANGIPTTKRDGTGLDIGWKPLKYRDWRPAALRVLQNHLFVVIGGVHIQELTNAPLKIANLNCPTLPGGAVDISQPKDGVLSCTVAGSGLDKLSSVNLELGTTKIAGKVKAAKDGNSATIEFDPSALCDGNGLYSLYLVVNDANGNAQEADSGEKVSLSVQTNIASVDPQLDLSQSKNGSIPLALTGKHLDNIVHLYLVPSDKQAVEATGNFTAGKGTTIDKSLSAEFATSGTSGLVTGTTYYVRYTVKDELGKQIDATWLTVKTINQPPAAAGKGTAPIITKLSATAGPVGTAITITGTDFGATQGSSTVTFDGTPGTPKSWSATSIVVPVPPGAKSGDVIVTVGGVASKGVKFTVGPVPIIGKLSVNSGAAGTAVTITGTGFGAAQGTSTVTFGGTAGKPTSWNATTIAVPVPTGAKTGNVVVTVGGVPSKGVKFTIP